MQQLLTVFKIPELRRKIIITLIFLAVYRIGFYIPLPIIDQVELGKKMAAAQTGALGQVLGFVSLFSGGNLSQACIFSLGIMPYISASIIIQLLASGVVPSLEKLRKEGEAGPQEVERDHPLPDGANLHAMQALMVVNQLMRAGRVATGRGDGDGGEAGYADIDPAAFFPKFKLSYFAFSAMMTVTAGTIFLMWLGEQIDEYGIGNGISLIIMAGIVARLPGRDAGSTARSCRSTSSGRPGKVKESLFTLGGCDRGRQLREDMIVLLFLFVAVVVGVIAMTKAQRRIPTQSAKHVRGRRVYGGTRQFLPMKVNAAGRHAGHLRQHAAHPARGDSSSHGISNVTEASLGGVDGGRVPEP